MFRLFTTKLSFNAESTATKILFLMKDLYRNNRSPQRYPHPGSKQYDSNNIIDKSLLVTRLSKIILEIIDYEQYKNLSESEINYINMSIARALYFESEKHESSYYEDSESPWNNGRDLNKAKGISFSLRITQYPIDEAYEVNFPKDLFLNQPLIIHYIYTALQEYPNILRRKENEFGLICGEAEKSVEPLKKSF